MGLIGTLFKNWFGTTQATAGVSGSGEIPHAKHKIPYEVIRVQPTPNPDAFQFTLNMPVIGEGTRTFESPEDAKGDPFAEQLFQLFGVQNVFLKENFVTVTKSPSVGWHTLLERINDIIEEFLVFQQVPDHAKALTPAEDPLADFKKEDFGTMSAEQKGRVIEAILDKAIRPALSNDGGGLDVLGIEGNVVKIHYQGACGSCPSSTTGTLLYIENFLRENVHSDLEVRAN
ncbi:MAG: NifU family protein [Nitrospinae bacterium CG11_big_fil_rev_8_21_14_0_20_56_8]|nr:MAG: NifU family protein [Nitrospinae bacterium CG11_big_fil_rev_8_21_14_0_20_56_8]